MNKGEIGIWERSGLVYEETETFSRDLECSCTLNEIQKTSKKDIRIWKVWHAEREEEDVRGNASYVSDMGKGVAIGVTLAYGDAVPPFISIVVLRG